MKPKPFLPPFALAAGPALIALLTWFAGDGTAGAQSPWTWPEGPAGPLVLTGSPTEPEGYRMSAYRSPVPATLRGATVVTSDQALDLWLAGSVHFIDVLPRPPRPEGLPDDVIWRPPPRLAIPGGVWLANVGFGALNPELEAYFRDNLARITTGRKDAPVLFYCLADCWMSWNAAKRAISYGYKKVLWFPEGTDAWTAAGLPTELSEPTAGWAPE